LQGVFRRFRRPHRATGHVSAYFPPLFQNFLTGTSSFAPEIAEVTRAGGEKLAEPYVIRPTSERLSVTFRQVFTAGATATAGQSVGECDALGAAHPPVPARTAGSLAKAT